MRFTKYQYDEAIVRLQDAAKQLEADGNCCSVCGDSGHMAFECGLNPLVAIAMCRQVAQASDKLHEILHWMAGFDQAFGVQLGPAKCHLPFESAEAEQAAMRGV